MNMSFYIVKPTSCYTIMCKCSSCNQFKHFISSGKFRVNANKKLLDIWIIYKCETCGSTKNISVYERMNISTINHSLYEKFVNNDPELIFQLATNRSVFARNSVSIFSIDYEIQESQDKQQQNDGIIHIYNPFLIHIKTTSCLAIIMNKSHSKIKKLVKAGKIEIESDYIKENELVKVISLD